MSCEVLRVVDVDGATVDCPEPAVFCNVDGVAVCQYCGPGNRLWDADIFYPARVIALKERGLDVRRGDVWEVDFAGTRVKFRVAKVVRSAFSEDFGRGTRWVMNAAFGEIEPGTPHMLFLSEDRKRISCDLKPVLLKEGVAYGW